MRLWKRAAGALKDQNNLLVVALSRRTRYRIPQLETAIIKATSHDETKIDYKSAERVFKWIRTPPVSLKPFLYALTARMERTSSWAVALKGLILIHGVLCCKIPAVQKLGRLPFDFSEFEDGHTNPRIIWGFNSFIRAYFTFLDNRGALLYAEQKESVEPGVRHLSRIKDMQELLDLLFLVRPKADNMKQTLILEAMDCVVVEVFNLSHMICNHLPVVLKNVENHCFSDKTEAAMAMNVIQKAKKQFKDINLFFKFCKVFGVANAYNVPGQLPQVFDQDIEKLQQIMDGGSSLDEDENHINENALIVIRNEAKPWLQTVITKQWEFFDDFQAGPSNTDLVTKRDTSSVPYNPFESIHMREHPDLISL